MLAQNCVMVKFSKPCIGETRLDRRTTEEIKRDKSLGANAGNWDTRLWEPNKLAGIKTLQNEAQAYHDRMTFPFGFSTEKKESIAPADDKVRERRNCTVASLLPALLYKEYMDQVREYQSKLSVLVDEFLADPQSLVDWAVLQHNGTFDPRNYPGVTKDSVTGKWVVDADVFRARLRNRFAIEAHVMPVPGSNQYEDNIKALLGVDAQGIDNRVRDAEQDAQRELLKRMIDPIQHMASKLAGQCCHCSNCKGKASKTQNFKDTLVSNVQEIAQLVPKMNLTGDPELNRFASEMEALTRYTPDALRDNKATRDEAASKAAELLKKLSGYGM